MEKLAERRIKIEATNDISTPGGRNPQNSGDIHETGSTGSTGDENAPSFTTREEYNKILKDMGFNRTEYSYDGVLLLFTGAKFLICRKNSLFIGEVLCVSLLRNILH